MRNWKFEVKLRLSQHWQRLSKTDCNAVPNNIESDWQYKASSKSFRLQDQTIMTKRLKSFCSIEASEIAILILIFDFVCRVKLFRMALWPIDHKLSNAKDIKQSITLNCISNICSRMLCDWIQKFYLSVASSATCRKNLVTAKTKINSNRNESDVLLMLW